MEKRGLTAVTGVLQEPWSPDMAPAGVRVTQTPEGFVFVASPRPVEMNVVRKTSEEAYSAGLHKLDHTLQAMLRAVSRERAHLALSMDAPDYAAMGDHELRAFIQERYEQAMRFGIVNKIVVVAGNIGALTPVGSREGVITFRLEDEWTRVLLFRSNDPADTRVSFRQQLVMSTLERFIIPGPWLEPVLNMYTTVVSGNAKADADEELEERKALLDKVRIRE